MRISNFGMGVLHVKVKYWRIFCDVISLLAQVFILSSHRVSRQTHTHTHTHRQTGSKQYPATPSGGEVTIWIRYLWRSYLNELVYVKYNMHLTQYGLSGDAVNLPSVIRGIRDSQIINIYWSGIQMGYIYIYMITPSVTLSYIYILILHHLILLWTFLFFVWCHRKTGQTSYLATCSDHLFNYVIFAERNIIMYILVCCEWTSLHYTTIWGSESEYRATCYHHGQWHHCNPYYNLCNAAGSVVPFKTKIVSADILKDQIEW